MSDLPVRAPEEMTMDAERYFAARGARAVPGRAQDVLSRSGRGNTAREDDRLG